MRYLLSKKKSIKPSKAYKKKLSSTTRKSKSTLVTKAVLYKAIKRNEETKVALNEQPFTLHNSGINNADYYNILPSVGQGTQGNLRLGDSIRPIKLVFNAVISYNTNTSYVDPQMIISRLFCFQQKGIRDYVQISNVSTGLLQNGANPLTFTGSLVDISRPKNTDVFTFYADRKHRFMKPYGLTGNPLTPITSMHSSMVQFVTITLTEKHMPATLKFSSTSNNYANNFLPLVALGYAYAQNQSPDISNLQLGISWTSTLYYKDS